MVRVAFLPLLIPVALGQSTDIYNQPVSTVLGCTCKTLTCTTSALFDCDAAPFCAVDGPNCARGKPQWSITYGYYDYCIYEPYGAYEKLSAETKKTMVMSHVLQDAGTSGEYPATIGVLTGIMAESVRVSFDASADVFPEKRTKYIHSVGVTGGIKFESTGDHAYGGLFQGAEHGMIRFSSAKQPSSGGVAPGMGVKFFRDGRPSANFVSMFSLDGQPCSDTDFFAHDWSNHISSTDNFGLKLIAAKFWQSSYCPLMVGLSDMASASDGSQAAFPFRLDFHALVQVDCPCTNYVQCLANLQKLAVGTKIFEVRAQAAPQDATKTLIGHIVLTDKLVTSKFGDEKLFFSHQHMENDYELKPEWLEAIDRKKQCGMGCTGTKAPPISMGCSSPFNSSDVMSVMLSTDATVV